MTQEYYFYDTETTGTSVSADRVMQFAGIRTDSDFNIIGEPTELYCKLADDIIPSPMAISVTGITPQVANERGLPESDFFAQINQELSRPGTCSVGFNSMSFDTRILQFGFYRNFIDPYRYGYANGNSQWDIFHLVQMVYAFRPDSLKWKIIDGKASMKLTDITEANGISQIGAHDALVDVRATIAVAKLIREREPKLFDFCFNLRDKKYVSKVIKSYGHKFLDVSWDHLKDTNMLAPVMHIAEGNHATEVYVYDLTKDPSALLEMTEKEIAENLFAKKDDLGNVPRVGLRKIATNKAPTIAPYAILDNNADLQSRFDLDAVQRNLALLKEHPEIAIKVSQAVKREFDTHTIAEEALYDGFIETEDRWICNRILKMTPTERVNFEPRFKDARLQAIYPRYLGRNYPELLNQEQFKAWSAYAYDKLVLGIQNSGLIFSEFNDIMLEIEGNEKEAVLADLFTWVSDLIDRLKTDNKVQ